MKASLESKTNKICVVVRKNKKIDIATIKNWCETYCDLYAFIEHEQDITPQGVKEGCHYHIVARLKERKRLATTLNELVFGLGLDNGIGIEIDRYNCLEGSIQYLIHKNDLDKTQHKPSEIVTNLPKEELETILEAENDSLTFDRLFFLCKHSKSKCEIMRAIGLGYYQHYRNCILDILEEVETGKA